MLIRALKELGEETPVSLTLVGDGKYRPALEELAAQLGVSGRITFTGWVSRQEMKMFYAESDVVVAPTLNVEPLGMVAIEAMSVGRPVIASRRGGFLETVVDGATGILFEPGDHQALAWAVQRLAYDRNLRIEMGNAGSKRRKERFSAAWSAQAFIDFYKKVSKGQGCTRTFSRGET